MSSRYVKGESKMSLQKVQVNLDASLVERVDDYAKTLHVNRTAAISVLLSRALQAEKSLNDLGRLLDAYDAEKGAQEV